MSKYLVSHYFPLEPVVGYWQGLPYLTAMSSEGHTMFRRGKKGWKLIDPEEVKLSIDKGQLVQMDKWEYLEEDESLFLSPAGEIVIGKGKNIEQDQSKRYVGRLPHIPKWLLDERVKLRRLGVDPALLLDPSVPDELHVAASRLLARSHARMQQVLESLKRTFIVCADSGYETEGGWLNQIRASLRSLIKKRYFGCDVIRDTRSYFDQLLLWDRALTDRIIYLFPFFLSDARSEAWGVIRYGWQRELGILIHTTHPSYRSWLKMKAATERGEVTGDDIIRKGQAWVAELVQTSLAEHRERVQFRFFQGYIFEEIVRRILDLHFEPTQMMNFGPLVEPIPRRSGGTRDESYPPTMNMRDVHDLFFFDPAEVRALETDLEQAHVADRRTVRIEHGIKVPVGIGFSLPMLRDLLTDGRWITLLKAVTRVLRDTAVVDNMRADGIEIDAETLAYAEQITVPAKKSSWGI